MTYFGRAFFAESLRENSSFGTAFDAAKVRVTEREAAMGFEPSNPQMFVGGLMKTALPALEQALFEAPTVSSDFGADANAELSISIDGFSVIEDSAQPDDSSSELSDDGASDITTDDFGDVQIQIQ